jgi:hypothetical protein
MSHGCKCECCVGGLQASKTRGVPCLDKSDGHLATLAAPPILSGTHLKDPSGLGRDSESEGEAAELPQPQTVEAMCKANL